MRTARKIIKGGIVREFINWFHSRGEFYAGLPVMFYVDGEPYFKSQGAECSLRDYLRVKNELGMVEDGENKLVR